MRKAPKLAMIIDKLLLLGGSFRVAVVVMACKNEVLHSSREREPLKLATYLLS